MKEHRRKKQGKKTGRCWEWRVASRGDAGSPGSLGLVEEEGEGDSSGGWCGVFRGKWGVQLLGEKRGVKGGIWVKMGQQASCRREFGGWEGWSWVMRGVCGR